MKKYLFIIFTTLFLLQSGLSQKKAMDQATYAQWNSIASQALSNNGDWLKYHIVPGKGDKTLKLYNTRSREEFTFDRVIQSFFSHDNSHLIFSIGHPEDSLTVMKRNKVDKKDLPMDSLIVLNLKNMKKAVFPHIVSYKVPQKWSGLVAFQAKVQNSSSIDTSKNVQPEEKFIIYDLGNEGIDTLGQVDGFFYAEEAPIVIYHKSGKDSSDHIGVYRYDHKTKTHLTVSDTHGQYSNLTVSEKGDKVGFIADMDTTTKRIRPFDLFLWKEENKRLDMIVSSSQRLTDDPLFVSNHMKPQFSKDGLLFYFGISPHPILGDSLALPEDEVSVEVWTTEDPILYTMQEVQKSDLENKAHTVVFDIDSRKFQVLESGDFENLRKSNEGNGPYYLTSNSIPYSKAITWEGSTREDYKLFNLRNGSEWKVEDALTARVRFSPGGQFLFWFDRENLDWFTYEIATKNKVNLTQGTAVSFTNELHDSPSKPNAYGSAGWTENDESILIYDRYDIWKFDPKNIKAPVKLTEGRSNQVSHRLIILDREQRTLENDQMVFLFNEGDKSSGYGTLELNEGNDKVIEMGDYAYTRRPLKAKNTEDFVFSKSTFELFPDLILSNTKLQNQSIITSANPQQKEYRWGTIEIFEWEDFKGQKTQGLLVKPEGFDPLKKYPVIVNFYEKSSDGLHRHRAPEPHRSTINYSYYANKGYVIFNPDIRYEIGYPGESCYNAVVSGVEALSKNQFVDKDRIGVQGHSWGGYQIAYLLNRTDLFKCAESGAPVVNMISAYGGIRWGSGMSRMFQYEKTQSRLGATLWEKPELYIENSPIFDLDKTNTPVLILHNDKDTAVPWYQGIEYFMGLRRLNKKAWFLNYNGEPHWPLKWENRLDFNKRMEQFFAHYLLDQPMPSWMKRGVPVTEKGIRQGFEIDR